jgi:predicted esterase
MKTPVSGVFAMSSYLPMGPRVREQLEAERAVGAPKKQTTFCLANGTNDPKVKFPWAQWSEEALRTGGCDVHLISYLYVFILPAQTVSSAMVTACTDAKDTV